MKQMQYEHLIDDVSLLNDIQQIDLSFHKGDYIDELTHKKAVLWDWWMSMHQFEQVQKSTEWH